MFYSSKFHPFKIKMEIITQKNSLNSFNNCKSLTYMNIISFHISVDVMSVPTVESVRTSNVKKVVSTVILVFILTADGHNFVRYLQNKLTKYQTQ